ncbi:hypothetical protein TNCV_5059071 [Trichonephila clavipes]|nr:hypothetical protein TNCV_5059071 [Trichonephila clavipes]
MNEETKTTFSQPQNRNAFEYYSSIPFECFAPANWSKYKILQPMMQTAPGLSLCNPMLVFCVANSSVCEFSPICFSKTVSYGDSFKKYFGLPCLLAHSIVQSEK